VLRRRREVNMDKINNYIKEFIKEEDGIGVVEIILIIVVLIGLVIIFRDSIESLVKGIFNNITGKTENITGSLQD
jgi:Flp pilus assembly pilin Flp